MVEAFRIVWQKYACLLNKQGCQTLCKAIEYFLQIATLGQIEEKEVIVKIETNTVRNNGTTVSAECW